MPGNAFMKALNGSHRILLAVTRGRVGWQFGPRTVLEVTTTGRKSGQPRTVLLTSPIARDGGYVLVASKGGYPDHPDWYKNMVTDPRVTVSVAGGAVRQMVARTASADERTAMWPEVVRAYRGYASYQRRTQREIPLVVVSPAD
jgi:deazaflavin-dependent oxidoreductase (nitroreductase family)